MSIEVLEVKILDSYSITKTFPGKLLPIEQSKLAFEIPGKIKNIYVDVGDFQQPYTAIFWLGTVVAMAYLCVVGLIYKD